MYNIGDKIKVTHGVFKGETGAVRVVDANDRFLITFDKPELDLNDIHFSKNEITNL